MKTVVHISQNTDEAATRAFNNLKNLANTLQTMDRSPDDLIPGVGVAADGGVVEFTRKPRWMPRPQGATEGSE